LSSEQANFNGQSPYNAPPGKQLGRGTKVGSYKPNAFGLYDMHGNAWEWCLDFFDPNYYKVSPREDPKGPANGNSHPLRSGGWFRAGSECRSAMREPWAPQSVFNNTGFRVVLEMRD
jgi:formylglycine-generating enzyme required for sulfatase activity